MDLVRGQAMDKNVEIKVLVESTHQVYADRTGLALILRNLISNGIKFTPEGGELLVEADEVSGMIMVSVQDSGIGMSPEVVNHIFEEKNYQSTRGTKNEVGSGLGLKIAKKFVELSGGQISVESKEGSGSCFKFSLPKSS